ncbi:MAG: arylamine N-acetyltransferase [Proteobacteria bacterium]|nr:arylamine N-acetyltransferase [Pseudomonadota bacterium]
MSHTLDLDAYFARIGYEGDATPTLETLQGLHRAHPQAIPFENLDILLGRPPALDPASLERKLVSEGRGGYCYEHNGLFAAVLEAIGFRVVPLGARVVWGQPADRITPRTHEALFVELDGEAWLCDVGFGREAMSAPLRLNTDEPQRTPHGTYRVTPNGHELLIELQTPLDERLPMYLLSLEPQADIDLELSNWWVATHPSSPFVQSLRVARLLEDGGRIGLLNREFTMRGPDGSLETTVLAPGEVAGVLSNRFDLPFAWSPELEPIFAGLPEPD